jgi:crotonobetainyl-CoA:carnitine CoA-transferase CaiB-like acyl-CoA transferase
MYYATDNEPPPPRTGASHATIYPYGPFLAGDGISVMLGLQNEREWVRFCETVLQMSELASNSRFNTNSLRNQNRSDLEGIILSVFASLTASQVIHRLDDASIANARMNNMADLWAHPQLQARKRWAQVDSPVGPLPALLPPGLQSGFEYTMGPIPSVGQHNAKILEELGLTLSLK